MKTLKKNKGAALIAVLIGVLFITILASSMLYMTTINYKMKSQREFASDNFYTAEFGLNQLMTQLRQYSSVQTDPKGSLRGYLNGGGNHFNVHNLQNMVDHLDSSLIEGLQDIKVSDAYAGTTVASYEETGNYIYLRGVQITATTDSAHGSYESNIVTDIAIGFPASSDSPGKLNDFSILSDSPLEVSESSQYFGGDVYMRKNGTLGNDALRVGPLSVVTILGNYTFLDGDLTVQSGGVCYLAGTTYVRGNINVEGTGQVLYGGNLYIQGSFDSGKVVSCGAGEIHTTGVKWDNYEKYKDGLGGMLVSKYMHFHFNSSNTSDGYGNGGRQCDALLTQQQMASGCHNGGLNKDDAMVTGTVDGVTASAIYFTNDNNISEGWVFNDCLIVSPSCPSNFEGKLINCTFLNVCNDSHLRIHVQAKGFPWGTMDDRHFDTARKLFVKGGDGGFAAKIKNESKSLSTENLVPVAGTSDTFTLGGDTIKIYTTDDAGKPYYYNTSNERENYFTFDNFFDKNMEKTLREFKGAAGNSEGSGSAQPMIKLINWTKD